MEATSAENSQSDGFPAVDTGDQSENTVVEHVNNDFREEEPKLNMNGEEIREILEVIAATGKFWHDWDMLKSLLSFRLKQALAEYSESQMDSGIGSQQGSLPGETYSELVKRLDEGGIRFGGRGPLVLRMKHCHLTDDSTLLSFMEGPPFTLQRLCEILLAPRSIYPKLSKLALALEKNLLVTSTLTKCTDPYPIPRTDKPPEPGTVDKQIQEPSYPVLGEVENSAVEDGDEEMAEAEAHDTNVNKETKMEEEKVGGEPESGSDQNKD